MTLPRPILAALLVAVAVLVVAVGIVLHWLLGEPITSTSGAGVVGAGAAAAEGVRRAMRQTAREEADDIIGGLGPDPATLREQAAQEDAEIAEAAEGVPVADLLDDWRRG